MTDSCFQLDRHSPTVLFPIFVGYAIYADYTNTQRYKQKKAELAKIFEAQQNN